MSVAGDLLWAADDCVQDRSPLHLRRLEPAHRREWISVRLRPRAVRPLS